MRRILPFLTVILTVAAPAQAAGLLIPVEKALPPLAMLDHKVDIAIEDQVAITKIEQTFRNHTDRQLEATYIFPIPKGASVRKFSMWVNGKEVAGELVEADKARQIYTSIVQRTLDPGLLEYMGNNLLKLRVFPVPARGDQKISISYTSIAPSDNGLIEFLYPLKADARAASTLKEFSLKVNLKSQHSLQNIYSPTHAITMVRPNDKEAIIGFEKDQAVLDRDFQLFYALGNKDVEVTALTQRPNANQDGYFMMLLSPRAELSKSQQVPRDMVFVLDTSGSMRGKRMTQARKALQYCLNQLTSGDRFGVLNFATTVNMYTGQLQQAIPDNVAAARKWVDALEATGGTAINDALAAALALREKDGSRTFTIVFFTDGMPTIGETRADKILQNVAAKNTGNTRIFTFGVGDDVNAALLDQLADSTRAVSTYVRESEDIESKVSGLYAKISNPVLANLKLAVGAGVTVNEVYPPQLPDLFHGSQLVVLGRYNGKGQVAVTLTGNVGGDKKEFVYEATFPEKTVQEKAFVEDLWARRKVGFMLDQIRANGEKKELVQEVITLAKRYGITTPYTSYLVVPDGVVPGPLATRRPAQNKKPDVRFGVPATPPALAPGGSGGFGGAGASAAPLKLEEFARGIKDADALKAGGGAGKGGKGGAAKAVDNNGGVAGLRDRFEDAKNAQMLKEAKDKPGQATAEAQAANATLAAKKTLDQAREYFFKNNLSAVQNGRLGVDFATQNSYLRNQAQLSNSASRNVQNRNVLEIGGVWIDDAFDPKMTSVTVKAMSKAYFRMLERQPNIREVFQLGNHIVWVSPSGTALIIDLSDGREEMSDADIDRLFVPVAKK